MRPLALALLLVVSVSLPQLAIAQSSTITFRASLKSPDNSSLSDVYVRIFGPDEAHAVDSLFSDDAGNIERQLPFSWTGTHAFPGAYAAYSITGPMQPNVISASTASTRIAYDYPAGAQLFFRDIQGKRHANGSLLSSGLYFYYMEFDDGYRSGVHKMLLVETCMVNVELSNQYKGNAVGQTGKYPGGSRLQGSSQQDAHMDGSSLKAAPSEAVFYAEFIKDGYKTLRDTIYIDGAIIERTYQLEAVDLPTAAFSVTGDLLAGQPVLFDASASAGAYGEELVYSWDFGDDKRGQAVGMPHIFVTPGVYEVQLTVAGNYGAKHQVSQSLTITAEQVATQFSGTVIASIADMDGMDLKDVQITLVEDNQEVLTDQHGMALLEDLPMGIPLHFRITREGYVTQVAELTIPETTGEAVFFASLMERAPAITFRNVEFGGTKSGRDGAAFSLPVAGLVKRDGSAVKGDVEVYVTPVDVAYDAAAFPGSFTGYRTDGEDGVLLSYGVAEYHFEQDGEALQLSAGKKATILIPVYTSGASAGDEIPLWSVDEESGTWVEEGTGTIVESDASPTGLAYRAEIGHLSWWNCDDFDEDKRRDGLCYRLECTSAICERVKVGCWMSGAIRDKKKSASIFPNGMNGETAASSVVAREDIPPVFEVRDFIPETGKSLRFPATQNVLVDARAYGPNNQLFRGQYIVEASDPSDTFGIELVPLVTGDTLDLAMNSYREFYLEPDEILTFRVEIPVADDYRIYAEPGGNPRLYGIFNILQEGASLLSGDIGTQERWVNMQAGTLYISIAGQQATSEGNFFVGIQERDPMQEGDTLVLALNTTIEEFLEASEYKHFRVDIPSEGLYRVDLKLGSSPSLYGRFEVHGTGAHVYSFLTVDDHGYILADPGEYILSVAGLNVKQKGNFIIGIWEVNATPLALNDSIVANMPETDELHMYSIQSPVNTMLDCRFYQVGDPMVSGAVSLVSPSGKILGEGNLYTPGARIVSPLAKDSIYYLEVARLNSTFDYVLIPEEDAPVWVTYGDTLNERLRYREDIDMYNFEALAGDVVSIRGFQSDYQLSTGYFGLWNEAGKVLAEREISYNTTLNDYEIVYEITETGTYSIIVGSHQADTGSYRVILQQISPPVLAMDELTELEVEANHIYYECIELADPALVHFSIVSDNGSGNFHLWDAYGKRLTEFNNNCAIKNFYNASYTGQLPAGKYFVRIDNENAQRLYLNLATVQPLAFDVKGKAAFTETLDQAYDIYACSFSGKPGDGVHGILEKNGSETAPEKSEFKFFRITGAGSSLYADNRSAGYYGLDDNLLHESATRLEGEPGDTIFVVVATGTTPGSFRGTIHHVAAADEISVDDDFVQFPDAQTSSHIAAGYAVRESGTMTISNGEYTSMLPMMIEANDVTLIGQEQEGVLLRNVYNYSGNPVICFYSATGYIGEMSLSCGNANYYAIEFLHGGITMDHLHIKPLEGNSNVGGGIKGSGNNMTLTHITMTNSTYGMQLGSSGAVIEDCDLLTEKQAIALVGEDIVIRNNHIEVTSSNRAIVTGAVAAASGSQLIEGNTIHMTREGYTDGNGIINVENVTQSAFTTSTTVRNNTIHSAGNNAAFYLTVGNPPSTITVENNSYYGTGPGGGKALTLQAGRYDGVSTVIVRNNTFSGLRSESSIMFYGAEYINKDERFAIYNNSFRLAGDAMAGAEHSFVEARATGYDFTDTASIYLVNNIFQGNGTTSFLKCSNEFSVYADYNTVYNFSSYLGSAGIIIGTTHDATGDPLFTDDDLHVDVSSPVIDKGADGTLFPGIPGTDKEGVVRPQGAGYDMGAYEQ